MITSLIVGGIAGFLAAKFMKGEGFGIIMNIILGIVGGVIGGWAFGMLGLLPAGIIGDLVTATVGAVILLWIAEQIRKRKS